MLREFHYETLIPVHDLWGNQKYKLLGHIRFFSLFLSPIRDYELPEGLKILLNIAILFIEFLFMAGTWRVGTLATLMGYLQVSVTFLSNTFTTTDSVSAQRK